MYNICIVGFGSIGFVHAETLKYTDNVRITAICDIQKDRADKGAEQYNCKAFYNYDEALTDAEIDSIHICTPHYLHFEMIKKAIEHKKIVIVEKPVAMKKEEFDILCSAYSASPIYPVFQNRTNNSVIKLKSLINSDKSIGELVGARAVLTWKRDKKYYEADAWRGTQDQEGGGVLINQAIHTLDLLGCFCNGFKAVTATASNKSLKGIIEVEDTIDAVLTTSCGSNALFYASNAMGTNIPPQLDIIFKNKSFSYRDGKLYCDNLLIAEDDNEYIGKSCYGCGHKKVFDSIYNGKGNRILIPDIKNSMYAMYAMYESAKNNGKTIYF